MFWLLVFCVVLVWDWWMFFCNVVYRYLLLFGDCKVFLGCRYWWSELGSVCKWWLVILINVIVLNVLVRCWVSGGLIVWLLMLVFMVCSNRMWWKLMLSRLFSCFWLMLLCCCVWLGYCLGGLVGVVWWCLWVCRWLVWCWVCWLWCCFMVLVRWCWIVWYVVGRVSLRSCCLVCCFCILVGCVLKWVVIVCCWVLRKVLLDWLWWWRMLWVWMFVVLLIIGISCCFGEVGWFVRVFGNSFWLYIWWGWYCVWCWVFLWYWFFVYWWFVCCDVSVWWFWWWLVWSWIDGWFLFFGVLVVCCVRKVFGWWRCFWLMVRNIGFVNRLCLLLLVGDWLSWICWGCNWYFVWEWFG